MPCTSMSASVDRRDPRPAPERCLQRIGQQTSRGHVSVLLHRLLPWRMGHLEPLIHGCCELPLDLKQKRKQEYLMVEGNPDSPRTSAEDTPVTPGCRLGGRHGAAKPKAE